jgi:NAD(P)-dependent dehydrogenase (short-subunit alcohol dehydrogenase family)
VTDPLFDISGKVALVTGGTSGIGLMVAEGLVARGVRTYIIGRDLGNASAIALQLSEANGGECRALSADFTDADAPALLAATLSERENGLNILVNNAGAGANGALSSATLEDWDLVLNVNLRSVFFLTRELLPLLRAAATPQDPARIINVGSIGGLHVPNWEAHSYGASKAAIHHLTRSLCKALGKDHITANAIAPGPFPSRMTNIEAEATLKAIDTYIPLRRAGTAEDVQGAIAFLSSRAGAFVNGHTLPLDGGYIAAL